MKKGIGIRAVAGPLAFALAIGVCGLCGGGSHPRAAAQSSKEPAVTLPSAQHGAAGSST